MYEKPRVMEVAWLPGSYMEYEVREAVVLGPAEWGQQSGGSRVKSALEAKV